MFISSGSDIRLQLYMQIGADILRKALAYPARQIAKNSGLNGNAVIEKVFGMKCS